MKSRRIFFIHIIVIYAFLYILPYYTFLFRYYCTPIWLNTGILEHKQILNCGSSFMILFQKIYALLKFIWNYWVKMTIKCHTQCHSYMKAYKEHAWWFIIFFTMTSLMSKYWLKSRHFENKVNMRIKLNYQKDENVVEVNISVPLSVCNSSRHFLGLPWPRTLINDINVSI